MSEQSCQSKSMVPVNDFDCHRIIDVAEMFLSEAFTNETYQKITDTVRQLASARYSIFNLYEDNGHGMDKETASQIFEPFFTTKEHGKGTGLGLATVFGIVKQNNGYVYCFSEEGVGTRFEIYFHKKDAKNKAAEVFEKPICIKGEESITILLVEDEPTILEMSRSMLQIFGYTVISAGSPQEALKKSLEHSGKIDLLITDVIMPEMNGRELSKKITSHHPEIKCLFMSGYTAEVIAYQGVIDEDMNFIQKPFTMKTLGEKVKTVMGVK